MEMNNDFNNKLLIGLRNKKFDLFDEGVKEFINYDLKELKSDDDTKKYIDNIGFSKEEEILFCIYASERCNDESFSAEVFPYVLNKIVDEDVDYFCDLLENNDELQDKYVNNFKKYNYVSIDDIKQYEKFYSRLFNLKQFRKKILDDNELVSKRFNDYYSLKLLPNDYGYLISYYTMYNDKTDDKLKDLYYSKITKNLSDEAKLDLIETHKQILEEPNVFRLETFDRMRDYEYCLKKITEDVTYYDILKKASNNTKLDMKTIIKFASKYDSEPIFNMIQESELPITDETREKIKYLSLVGKLKNSDCINNINDITIEELKEKEKDEIKNLNSQLRGGPRSNTNEKFFNKETACEKQLVRLNKDGTGWILGFSGDHQRKMTELYSEIKFPEDVQTVFDRAIYIIKKISSITLVVEGEICQIYMPSKVTKEQLNNLNKAIQSANENGVLTILKYDVETDEDTYPLGEDLITKNDALDYIESINKTHSL